MTHSGYFIIATTEELGMGIADGKIILCPGISGGRVDKKISTREYINRAVCVWLNNSFPDYFGRPYFNLPHIGIDDRHHLDKGARYTPEMPGHNMIFPSAIPITNSSVVAIIK